MTDEEKQIFLDYAAGKISREEAMLKSGWKKAAFNCRMRSLGYSAETHFFPGSPFKPLIAKEDQEFWVALYEKYISGESFDVISERLGIHKRTIQERFERFNLPLKSREQIESERIKNSVNAHRKKYGGMGLQNLEIQSKARATVESKYKVKNVSELPAIKRKISVANKEKTNLEKDLIQEKRSNTNRTLYSVDHVSQVPEFKRKIAETNLQIYGNESAAASAQIRKKIQDTNLQKYGSISPLANADVIQKRVETVLEEKIKRLLPYLKKFNYQLLEKYEGLFVNSVDGKRYRRYLVLHTVCGTQFTDDLYLIPRCKQCFPNTGKYSSQLQNYLSDLIESFKFNVKRNDLDTIKNIETGKWLEIDIFLPDEKKGFEINSLYHHCSHSLSWGKPIGKNYHAKKTEAALNENIRLLHIWDDWNLNIVESIIKSELGLSKKKDARKMTLDHDSTNKFFDENHVYGSVPCTHEFTLKDGDEIFAAMSFRSCSEGLEIARFASKCGYSVRGGFSRLLKAATTMIKPSVIISYCDRDLSPRAEDTVYFRNGFELVGDTGPRLFYTDTKSRWSREKFQKHKLKEMFPETYDEKLTADEILKINKIFPIWNSGNWKFIKKIDYENR